MAYNEVRDAVVEIKSEATPGTPETTGLSVVEINGTDSAGVVSPDLAFNSITVLRPDFDQRPGTPGRAKSNVTIPSYLTVGGESAGSASAPVNGILLKAAGLSETASGETVTYAPTTTDQSMTVRSYNDGILSVAAGVRGGFTLDFTAGSYPTINFTGMGSYSVPTAVAVPASPVYPDEVLHQVASAGMTINSVSGLVVRSFSFDWTVSQVERMDVNSAYGYVGEATTAKVGTINAVVEYQDAVATWNPEALLLAGTPVEFSLEIGDFVTVTSGSSVSFDSTEAQITSVSRSADSGVLTANISATCTGDSPFSLVFSSADIT
jgi:hypothetical protein